MSAIVIGMIVFAGVFGGALLECSSVGFCPTTT